MKNGKKMIFAVAVVAVAAAGFLGFLPKKNFSANIVNFSAPVTVAESNQDATHGFVFAASDEKGESCPAYLPTEVPQDKNDPFFINPWYPVNTRAVTNNEPASFITLYAASLETSVFVRSLATGEIFMLSSSGNNHTAGPANDPIVTGASNPACAAGDFGEKRIPLDAAGDFEWTAIPHDILPDNNTYAAAIRTTGYETDELVDIALFGTVSEAGNPSVKIGGVSVAFRDASSGSTAQNGIIGTTDPDGRINFDADGNGTYEGPFSDICTLNSSYEIICAGFSRAALNNFDWQFEYSDAGNLYETGIKHLTSLPASPRSSDGAYVLLLDQSLTKKPTGLVLGPNKNILVGQAPSGAITASGGTPPYSFQFSPGTTGIDTPACTSDPAAISCTFGPATASGTAFLYVTDANSNQASASITVSDTHLSVSPSTQNVQIGVANVSPITVSGGTGYTFALNDGGTGIQMSGCVDGTAGAQNCQFTNPTYPGTATLTIFDAGGGSATASIIVSHSQIYAIPANQTVTVGLNSPSNITVSGGTGYTFAFNDGGTGIQMSGCVDGTAGAQNCQFTNPQNTGTATLTISDTGGGSATATIVVISRPKTLSITKTANISEIAVGEQIQYTLTFQNAGTAPYTDLTIVDDYDENLAEIVAIPQNCTDANGQLSCVVGSLGGGETGTISYSMRAK